MASDPKGKKANAQYAHFKRRLRERWGIEINRHQHKDWLQQLRRGNPKHAVLIGRQSNRVSWWWLKPDGVAFWIPVVYDKQRGRIVTALPPDVEIPEIGRIYPPGYVPPEESTLTLVVRGDDTEAA